MIDIPAILSNDYEVEVTDKTITIKLSDSEIWLTRRGFTFTGQDDIFLTREKFLALAELQESLRRLMEAQK